MKSIARKTGITRDALWRDHLLPQVPVVLGDVAYGSDVASLRTLEACRRAFGDVPLPVRGEYTSGLLRALATGEPAAGPTTLAFDDYWHLVEREPDTTCMCIEEQAPDVLRRAFPLPGVCALRDGSQDPWLRSNMFVGNRGNVASIHFDGDCRHVLLYQVFGRKRVIVIGPEHGRAVRPLVNFGRLRLQAMPPSEQRAALDALDAWETILEPGEAIVMPALVYHYVEYLDHGMSLNYRFGRHAFHRFISEQLHFDAHVQRLASHTLDETALTGKVRAALDRLHEVYAEPMPTTWLKYLQMAALCEALADSLEAPAANVTLPASAYVDLPEVVTQYLLRAHLFNERLYRHRSRP